MRTGTGGYFAKIYTPVFKANAPLSCFEQLGRIFWNMSKAHDSYSTFSTAAQNL